jgi:glyoxylate reductase
MTKPKVYITRKIPAIASRMLKDAGYIVESYPKSDTKISRKELQKKVQGCTAILSLLTEKIDYEIMHAAGQNLKVISNFAVGFDNIDLQEAHKRGIKVGNTPSQEVNEAVAEMAMTCILALSRKLLQGDAYTKNGKYRTWDPLLMIGNSLSGKTLGIVGLGNIGSGLAHRAADGFGLKVVYFDLQRNKEFEKKYKAEYVSFDTLLKTSDFVSLHVPLVKSTYHLIGPKELKKMKKTAYLINTSRGPVVEEIALNKALIKGDIAGAAIDVYECEPKIDCNPYDTYALKKLDNIIMTPHIASATVEAREKMAIMAAQNIINALKGKKMPSQVTLKK